MKKSQIKSDVKPKDISIADQQDQSAYHSGLSQELNDFMNLFCQVIHLVPGDIIGGKQLIISPQNKM